RGYNTPSLYGTWLMAPYLHNGSVPTIWHLLRPDQRPDVWRTRLVGGSDQDRGFDTSLANYDFENLGWKFDVLNCGENDGVPFISCAPQGTPLMAAVAPLVELLLNIP